MCRICYTSGFFKIAPGKQKHTIAALALYGLGQNLYQAKKRKKRKQWKFLRLEMFAHTYSFHNCEYKRLSQSDTGSVVVSLEISTFISVFVKFVAVPRAHGSQ